MIATIATPAAFLATSPITPPPLLGWLDRRAGFFLDGADNDVEFDGLETSDNLGACCWGTLGVLDLLSITRGIDL